MLGFQYPPVELVLLFPNLKTFKYSVELWSIEDIETLKAHWVGAKFIPVHGEEFEEYGNFPTTPLPTVELLNHLINFEELPPPREPSLSRQHKPDNN